MVVDKISKARAAAIAALQAGEADYETRIIARRQVELEKGFWAALDEIALRESATMAEIVQQATSRDNREIEPALRSFALAYFRGRLTHH